MRLVTLAIVAGIGILIGVALYAGQALIETVTPHEKKIAANVETEMNGDGEIVEIGANTKHFAPRQHASFDSPVGSGKIPATYSNDVQEYRSQLPDAFQFPTTTTTMPVAVTPIAVHTPAPEVVPAQTRSDAPVVLPPPPPSVPQAGAIHTVGIAPGAGTTHAPGAVHAATAPKNNRNVQVEVSTEGGGVSRMKTIVNK